MVYIFVNKNTQIGTEYQTKLTASKQEETQVILAAHRCGFEDEAFDGGVQRVQIQDGAGRRVHQKPSSDPSIAQ